MKKTCLFISLLLLMTGLYAQDSVVENIPFTNIGPSIMSGRVVDFAVNPDNPTEFYVAYASGGLWYTNNNGTSFTPVMDNSPTQNVGDIAVDWKNGTLWVGTGESNSSRSSYAGIGILKSTDRGKSWKNVGLTDSQHIGRIVIHKNNPDEVIVGAIGHLYSENEERGIYKTSDGGETWNKVLHLNNRTGVIDITVSPTNPNVLYAASWERQRSAWNFDGDGEGSGIYKSTDAGDTWQLVTGENSGFPTGSGIGRIGLAAYNDNIVYALLDNQFMRPAKKKKETKGLKKDDFKSMDVTAFLALDSKELNTYLKENGFDRKHTAESVKAKVKKGTIQPSDLATYLEDANFVLLNSEVIGAEVYKSSDGGKSWEKTHEDYLNGVYSSYGYYFGIMAVSEADENKIYIGGVPLLRSDDGGKNFISIGRENVHSDHQALWVNPKLPGHIINGNDGGVNITYDDGENWSKNNSPAVGQFYAIAVDQQKPYNVYGGLQDNGVWYGPSNYSASKRWESSGSYPYKGIGGGDGMQVEVDNRDNNVVYSGSQFGYYYRVNLKTGERINIHPKHELGDSPYRYNWQTPILLSPHNQDIFYMGANKLLRSMDQGANFDVISPDLTTGGKKGNVPYGTLTSISESPFQFGLICTGSDDGYVYLTKDGGQDWDRISDDLPQKLWVSRVIMSQHEKERIYVALSGYRYDDFKPYLFVSDNNGKTWRPIHSNLPDSPLNVIREDTVDPNILYVGNDMGVYVSFDRGTKWQAFSNGLPKVAVHDLRIQEEAKDLVVGTHGRSIYKGSIASVQQYNSIKNDAITVFEVGDIRHSPRWGSSWGQWYEANVPTETIEFFTNTGGTVTVSILGEDEALLNSFTVDVNKGFNSFDYNLDISEKSIKSYFKKKDIAIKEAADGNYYLPKGKYTIKVSQGNNFAKTGLTIK